MIMSNDDVLIYIQSYMYFYTIEELKYVYDMIIVDGFNKLDIIKNFIKYIKSKIDEKKFAINLYKDDVDFKIVILRLHNELNCYKELLKIINKELLREKLEREIKNNT